MSPRSFLLDEAMNDYVVAHTEPVDEVHDPDDTGDDTLALRAYNDRAVADERVDTVLLPLADGLTVSQKR